ncbi:uncharacterized protein N7496_001727 [Penicillium cataractarum]|uniref:Uncharacterized protein n=1 Tax=Penicillium cataractarum TaxID=2100454 RepID=A0A9W9VWY3_9EURO|nr:uncharacterized protein N7496_001727 [Penicillium cataractarum]KAJ5390659.1 hypothetical protein N7496_001727 [Penicillium cataractarum]
MPHLGENGEPDGHRLGRTSRDYTILDSKWCSCHRKTDITALSVTITVAVVVDSVVRDTFYER